MLFDLGDFLDDYATDPRLRNDLGLLWLVRLGGTGRPLRLDAVPLHLGFCHTTLAEGADAAWVRERLHQACQALGTDVVEQDGRLLVTLSNEPPDGSMSE